MNPRLFAPKKDKAGSTAAPSTPSQAFVAGLPRNVFLAMLTTPSESAALRRIFPVLDNPGARPPGYVEILKNVGLKGLFAGMMSRTTYCLTGNFATILGIQYFGKDWEGLCKTTLAKNVIVPLFLISNARQTNRDFNETLMFMARGVKDPVVHLSFFLRNLVANSCLLPGFMVRDYSYKAMDGSNTQIPTFLGWFTSVGASTLMNSFMKPFFTGSYAFKNRWGAAITFPAKFALWVRESASVALIFANTPYENEKVSEVKATEEKPTSPRCV